MPASLHDKAVLALSERRVRVVKANADGIAADVAGSVDPATLSRPVYRAMVWSGKDGVERTCSCPAPKRCYHLAALELLWRPLAPIERGC